MGFVSDWRRAFGDEGRAFEAERRAAKTAFARNGLERDFALAAGGTDKGWYVAQAHGENRAADALRGKGVDLWQPRRKVTLPRRRGQGARDVERPTFPGYLFLRLPHEAAAFHAVLTVVDGLLGKQGAPQRQPDGLIAGLMLANDAGAFDDTACRRRAKIEAALKSGAAVRLGCGPFAGVIARAAEGWKGGATARLAAELFGGMTLVTMAVDELEVVEPA